MLLPSLSTTCNPPSFSKTCADSQPNENGVFMRTTSLTKAYKNMRPMPCSSSWRSSQAMVAVSNAFRDFLINLNFNLIVKFTAIDEIGNGKLCVVEQVVEGFIQM